MCAYPVVGNEPFAVVLPDVIIDQYSSDLRTENLAEMLRLYDETGFSQIMVEPVPMEKVSSYGIVDLNGQGVEPGESVPLSAIVEKPSKDEAPSNFAVVGRYVLSPHTWGWLKRTPLGAGDEIQLTDTIGLLMREYQVNAFHMTGKSHDCGSKMGYMAANVAYASRHPEVGERFNAFLKEYVKTI
jgi:UTP--glucose-1-phosphate uridylyltransferase